ncbi:long-chain-fatty-acid--CoA ligase [Bacillus sp. B190/17]|uniref:Long-chain-fatty-acid--CoA ligase n=1 Tax=Bacillus lumedeiriae TaxID=3058829 RepID=A0ABW8I758_9BACI
MDDRPWLAQYPEEIPATLAYEEQPVQAYLTKAARDYPAKTAIHFMGKELTFQEVYESSLKVGCYLKKLGVEKGDRVGIMLPNGPQAVISYFGILYAGGVVVQTNPLYTESEIEYQLKDSSCKVMITLDILYPRVQQVMDRTDLKHIIVTAVKDYLPFPKNILYPFIQAKQTGLKVQVEERGTNHEFKRIIASERAEELDIPFDFDEDIALLQYTGGTTGLPKGVMLTHKNLIANTSMCASWLYKCKKGEEVMLGLIPFFHVYGMTTVMILSIMQAYKMVLLPKFDVKMTLKTVHKQRPTLFPGAPTIYIALLNDPDLHKYDLSSIRACLSGSAPLPIEVQKKFEKATGGKLVEGYGLSETSPVTHSNFLWDREQVKGSIGVPWPDTEAAILSMGTGEILPPGEIGEIIIKGPQVMKGYWNRPEETEMTFKDGWLLTGDIGYMDDKGYFFIIDRKKDMIISGGYNIYPREVEEVLYEHEAVQEAVVVGVPHPYWGETVKAYIVLREGYSTTEEELNQFVRTYLAAYKVPRIYEFREELPKTAVGKILRRVLIDEERAKQEKTK